MCMRDSLETIPEYENFRAFQHVSGVSRRLFFLSREILSHF